MRIIAHRGNRHGPDKNTENTTYSIEKSLDMGFDVEFDLRYVDGYFYLGHDEPKELVDDIIFDNWSKMGNLYVHCKTVTTLQHFISRGYLKTGAIPFFHDTDECVLIDGDVLWVHPESIEAVDYGNVGNTIFVLPNLDGSENYPNVRKALQYCYGVCTDYAIPLRESLEQ